MTTMTDFRKAALGLTLETRAFIDGQYRASISGRTFRTIDPSTGGIIAEIASGDEKDIDSAVSAARRVFEGGSWSRMPARERKKILLRFADLLEAHVEELALLEVLDCGKPITDARNVDLPDSIETLRWHAELADKLHDSVPQATSDIVSMIVREPIGVVGAVIPWNFPIFVAMWKIAPALAGGNSLILKPAEQTSLSLIRIAALAAEAGIPDGVFNVVPGLGHEAGKAIGLHMDVDCVTFTGSGEVGRYFLEYSAKSNLKRIVLECGGKSPAIVMKDVGDLQPVIDHIATGILFCQGENCSAGSRLIVQKPIYDRVLDALKIKFDEWKVGDPFSPETKIGALIEEKHLRKVLGLIDAGRREGGSVAYGGNRVLRESGGFFVQPTIIENVKNTMTIAQEEVFGPVLSVLTVETEEDALRVANETRFGLAASVYTDDLNVAHRLARGIRAGTVSVNCFSEGDLAMPFGGYKESGFGGKDKGLAAHDQYLESKSIWIQLR